MMPLSVSLNWTDVATRLALTVVAGLVLGYNRSEHGKAAGMSTLVLVCLAASVAMLQVNILLPTVGRASDSFVMNDLMRLPLGILTGVGFIGAGAIMRRGSLVIGVTTAATLWLGTVIGLCIGGGQIALGVAATGLGLFSLWVLKWIEGLLPRERHARITLEADATGPDEAEVRRGIESAGMAIVSSRFMLDKPRAISTFVFEIVDVRRLSNTAPPGLVGQLARQTGIQKVEWKLEN
jgi:putative Mg2+ transporter-C (MgtC) family protein